MHLLFCVAVVVCLNVVDTVAICVSKTSTPVYWLILSVQLHPCLPAFLLPFAEL